MADQMVTIHQLKLEYGEYVRGMKQAAKAAAELAKARGTEAIADAKVMRQTEMYLAAVSRREATEARTAATIERLERQKAKAIENSTRAYRQQSQEVDKGLGVFQKAQKSAASVESQNAEIRRGVILAGQQFQDFAIQVAGGQSVMLAAAQQGSQLHYQLSTMTVGLRQFGAAFLRMVVNPITLGIAAFGALALAMRNTETSMRQMNKLQQQFSLSGMTFDDKQLKEFVKQMDALPGVSRQAALGVVNAFSGTEISQGLVKPALDQVRSLSIAMGEDIPKAGEALAGWLRSPSSAVDELRKRFVAFRGEAGDSIKNLEAIGNVSGAQAELLKTLAIAMKDVDEAATPLQKAIKELVDGFKNSDTVQGLFAAATNVSLGAIKALTGAIQFLNNNKIDWASFYPPAMLLRQLSELTDSFGNNDDKHLRVGELKRAPQVVPTVNDVDWSKAAEQGAKYNETLNQRAIALQKIAQYEKLIVDARASGKPEYEIAQVQSAIAEQRKKVAEIDKKIADERAKRRLEEAADLTDQAQMNRALLEAATALNAQELTKIQQLEAMIPLYDELKGGVKEYIESSIEQAKATERQNAADEVRAEKFAIMVREQVKDIERFNKVIEATPTSQLEKQREEVKKFTEDYMNLRGAFKDSDNPFQLFSEGINVILGRTKEATEEMSEFWKAAAQSMQSAMSDFFFDIMQGKFTDMVGGFKKAIDRMVADMLASQLLTFLKDTAKGGGFGSFIGGLFSANGNAFDGRGVIPFANGGVVSSATPFSFGGGNLGVMGEAGPEAIMPLKRGMDGKLGVQGGGNISIHNNFTINGPTDRRSQQQISAEIGAAVDRAMRRNR